MVWQPGAPPQEGAKISQVHDDAADRDLRARYLDYCAARISEVFLSLSDERTYQLMEEAAREANLEIGSLGFSEMMDLVTQRLRKSVPLPEFDTWLSEYEKTPEAFDHAFFEPESLREESEGE